MSAYEYRINPETGKRQCREKVYHGVNSFSGTDYRKQIDHPGVVFPLAEGISIPNFAGIIQHKQGFAELMYNEYRLFTLYDNGNHQYQKGRCLTLVKGYEVPEPSNEVVEEGLFDQLFKTKRPQPPKITYKKRKSYMLKNELIGTEGDDIGKKFSSMWEACNFEPDTETIESKNLHHGRGRLRGVQTTIYGSGQDIVDGWNNHGTEYDGLFEGQYSSHRNKKKKKSKAIPKVSQITDDDIAKITKLEEMGYDLNDILTMPGDEFNELWKLEFENEEEEVDDSKYQEGLKDMIDELVQYNVISLEKLKMMSDEAVIEMYNEVFEGVISNG